MRLPADLFVYILIIGIALTSFLIKKLTLAATFTATVVAFFIFLGGGAVGLEMLGAFFVLGVAATNWGKQKKEDFKIDADRGNRRNAWQVLANGGIAATCGLIAYLAKPHYLPGAYYLYKTGPNPAYLLMIAGSLAAATADTLSSELGLLYGRRFFNVMTLKNDQKGFDGVISMEGTLIGIAAAGIIALIYSAGSGFYANWWIVILAGALGNLADSVLGAVLERRNIIGNNVVNLLNTLTGALAALIIYILVK